MCPLPAGILLESMTTGTHLSLFLAPVNVRGRPANPFALVFARSLCVRLTALASHCARSALVVMLAGYLVCSDALVTGVLPPGEAPPPPPPRSVSRWDGRTTQPWRVVQGGLAAAASPYRPLLPSSMQHVRRVCRGRAGPRTPHTLGRCRSCWAAFARLGKHVTQEGSDLRDVPNVKKWYNRRVPMLD